MSARKQANNLRKTYLKMLKQGIVIKDTADATTTCYMYNPKTKESIEITTTTLAQAIGKNWKDITEFIPIPFIYNPTLPMGCHIDPASPYTSHFNKYQYPKFRQTYDSTKEYNEVPLPIEQFLRHLVNYNNDTYEYILDWMAHSFKFNAIRPFLTLLGERGVGKGTLSDIVQYLHGTNNFSKVRDAVLKKDFNAKLANKTAILIDELKLNNDEQLNRLKDLINHTIEIEYKGKDAVSVTNYAVYMIASNNMNALRLTADQRRFSIIPLNTVNLVKADFILKEYGNITNFAESIKDPDTIEALGHFLLQRLGKITRNMELPYLPENYEEYIKHSHKDWEEYFLDEYCIDQVGIGIDQAVMSLATIKDFYEVTFSSVQEDIKTRFGFDVGRGKFESLQKSFSHIFTVNSKRITDPLSSKPKIKKTIRFYYTEEDKEIILKNRNAHKNNQYNLLRDI